MIVRLSVLAAPTDLVVERCAVVAHPIVQAKAAVRLMAVAELAGLQRIMDVHAMIVCIVTELTHI
jgi:hypothetical protein